MPRCDAFWVSARRAIYSFTSLDPSSLGGSFTTVWHRPHDPPQMGLSGHGCIARSKPQPLCCIIIIYVHMALDFESRIRSKELIRSIKLMKQYMLMGLIKFPFNCLAKAIKPISVMKFSSIANYC